MTDINDNHGISKALEEILTLQFGSRKLA